MSPIIVILSVVLGVVGYYFLKFQKTRQMLNAIPGPKSIYILGNALTFSVEPQHLLDVFGQFCKEFYNKRLFRVWLGNRRFVVMFKAESVEAILGSHNHIDKSAEYDYLHKWLGTGLLTSTGKKWHSRRKILTPTFHFKILEDFIDVFNQQSNKLVQILLPKANGQSFDIFPSITHCTLDIIHETALGVPINAQDHSDSDYVQAVYKIGSIIQKRQIRPWYQYDFIYNRTRMASEELEYLRILHGQSNAVIEKRRAELESKRTDAKEADDAFGRKKKLAFLDLLLSSTDNGKPLSNEDIREEVDTFMFEGHDTTAAAISFCTYLLGLNPDKQKLLHEELDEIFGDDDRPATSEDLRNMKYLECCIKEALRLFPSVPIFSRTIREDVVLEDYIVPAGSTVLVISYYLHRDPEHFPNPEDFQPERFDANNSQKRHPYAYVPFSAGPRNCIGQKFAIMEEKVVLSSIFRNFKAESPVQRENLQVCGELILRPFNGLPMKLHPRK